MPCWRLCFDRETLIAPPQVSYFKQLLVFAILEQGIGEIGNIKPLLQYGPLLLVVLESEKVSLPIDRT